MEPSRDRPSLTARGQPTPANRHPVPAKRRSIIKLRAEPERFWLKRIVKSPAPKARASRSRGLAMSRPCFPRIYSRHPGSVSSERVNVPRVARSHSLNSPNHIGHTNRKYKNCSANTHRLKHVTASRIPAAPAASDINVLSITEVGQVFAPPRSIPSSVG